MTSKLRTVYKLCAGIFLCAAVNTSAHSQSRPKFNYLPPGPSEEMIQAAREDKLAQGVSTEGDWPCQEQTYFDLIGSLSGEDLEARTKTEEGGKPDFALVGWINVLRISEDQVRVMRAVAVEAQHELDAANIAYNEANDKASEERTAESMTKPNAFLAESARVVVETIGKLKQALGPDDFKKLDRWEWEVDGKRLQEVAKRFAKQEGHAYPYDAPAPYKEHEQQ